MNYFTQIHSLMFGGLSGLVCVRAHVCICVCVLTVVVLEMTVSTGVCHVCCDRICA